MIAFNVIPIFGISIAFQNFNPVRGFFKSEWVGLDNFRTLFMLGDSKQVFINTIFLAVSKIIGKLIFALLFALLLNELRHRFLKRFIQTSVYLPHFISWVLLSAIFTDMFSMSGMINQLMSFLGIERIMFMGSNVWFPAIVIFTDVWKEFGFNAIIFLAALSNINISQYESADIDGATRFKKMYYITLPNLAPTIVLLATLSLGSIMNANFNQIFNLINPLVYKSGDIIDYYVYRIGLQNGQYSLATALGLFKSVISFILIVTSYKLAKRFTNYQIF